LKSTKYFEICFSHDSAFSQNYLYFRCEKPRSSKGRHTGQFHVLDRTICSRSKCVKFKNLFKDFVSLITFDIEINVYHGRSFNANMTLPIYTAEFFGKSPRIDRVELSGGSAHYLYSKKHTSGRFLNISEELFSLVNISTKPFFIFRGKGE
jgi:hypothetical protein